MKTVALAAPLLLSTCAQQPVKFDFPTVQESGSSRENDWANSWKWNRVIAFRDADARLLSKNEHPRMAQVEAGEHTLLVASEGSIESRTANLLQYVTLLVCLPSELPVDTDMELKWADYDSAAPLRPGEAAVSVKKFFSGQQKPVRGQRAGRLKILSATSEKVRLQLEVFIRTDEAVYVRANRFIPGDPAEIGRLSRELKVEVRKLKAPLVVRKYPEGANQEVGLPQLGKMW